MARAMMLSKPDAVATLLDTAKTGESVSILNTDQQEIDVLIAAEPIRRGHKIAVRDIAVGGYVRKYGQVIGAASADILRGELVHTRNLGSLRGRGDLVDRTATPNPISDPFSPGEDAASEAIAQDENFRKAVPSVMAAQGGVSNQSDQKRPPVSSRKVRLFQRQNGTYGVRNRIAVIPSVACANHVAERIAAAVEIADAYTHPYGCDQLGEDLQLSFDCLKAMGTHPNVGAVLVVGLGCEEILPHGLYEAIHAEQPLAEVLVMQEYGGSARTIARGIEICTAFSEILQKQERVETDLSVLTIGLECGGSDFTSGIASNPVLGAFTAKLCAAGGRAVFGETTELMGAEEILRTHCRDISVFAFIDERIRKVEQVALDMHVDLRGTQPSPGNIEGGLSTIEEKSLGGVMKIGSECIRDAVAFGQRAVHPGVTYVDTPGNDLACSLGLAAAGAQIIIFTTGRGTPMGFAAAPVYKVTANAFIADLMRENFDLDLSGIIEGDQTISEGGEMLFEEVLRTAEGKETAAERLGHREFSLYRVSPVLT